MDIALVENDYALPLIHYEHDWIHLLYMSISVVFFTIQVCQRISVDLLYSPGEFRRRVFFVSTFCFAVKTICKLSPMSHRSIDFPLTSHPRRRASPTSGISFSSGR